MKEILILSTGHFELSTENVMDWLIHLRYKPQRLNGEDVRSQKALTSLRFGNTISFYFKNQRVKSSYHSIWFRRWSSFDEFPEFTQTCDRINVSRRLFFDLSNHIISDSNTINDFLLTSINTKIVLTDNKQIEVNKLNVLLMAKSIGMRIPRFIITNKKKNLIEFKKKICSDLVMKVLNNSFSYFTAEYSYMLYTELVTDKVMDELDESFPLTFFQEFIKKEFDLRVFYLNKKIYCMAILSQKSANSKIDCRKNNQTPIRRIPYKLPTIIENKIICLMGNLGLKTGLLDFVKSINGNYCFLEVNPVGQFNDMSRSCNYPIELDIAKYLIDGK